MKNYCRLFLLFFILFTSNNSKAQYFELPRVKSKSSIDFELVKNLVIIPVYINQKGPYNFILDTGVGAMLITDTTLVDVKKCRNIKNIKVIGLGKGDNVEAYLTNNVNASIGNAKANNIQTAILKADLFNLSSFTGIKISGLVGYPFFAKLLVKINYDRKTVQFANYRKKIKGEKINFELKSNKPYINTYLNIEKLGKINTKLLIDSGASLALSLETYNDKPIPLPTNKISANLGIGLNGEIEGYIGRVESLQLGDFNLKNVITNFPDYGDAGQKTLTLQRNGSIGADILRRFTLTFDYENDAVYFKKNSFFSEPFEHDMSGLEIFVDEKQNNRFFVNRVEKDSPAEKAGILENDEILGVNFTSAENLKLDELVNLFRFNENKTLFLELLRDKQVIYTLLRLKKRI